MIRYHFDLYPRDDPKDGARLVRFTKLQSAEYRGEANGTGAGQFSIRGDTTDAGFIDPRGLQYVRVVREDTDAETESVIGGFWLENGDFGALTERSTRLLTFGGPGTIAYLGREVLWSRAYLYADDNIIDGTTWHFYNQPSIAGGDYLGAVLWRVMAEAQSFASPVVEVDDKPETAIPESSTSFGQFNDSAANLWTIPSGEFKAQVGDNILTIVRRLMEAGLYIEAHPDTFVLNAWERGATSSRGQDKTGPAWAADVIRFQAPTDGTIATGNIKSDATRGITPFLLASTVLTGDNGTYVADTDVAVDVAWHRYYPNDSQDPDTLAYVADAQLTARGDAADTLRLRMKMGTDPTVGEYLPLSDYDPSGTEPNGIVMLNDLVTVHTGTGEWDYNEDTFPVAALTIILRPGGDWDAFVDLGSTYTSMAERAFQARGTPTHSHPPNPELCRPATVGSTSTLYDLNWDDGNRHTVDIYPSGTGFWPPNAGRVIGGGGVGGTGYVNHTVLDGAGSPNLVAIPGTTYTWSFWARRGGGILDFPNFAVSYNDAADTPLATHDLLVSSSGYGDWTFVTADSTAPANSAYMLFHTNGGNMDSDELSVTIAGAAYAPNDGHADLVGSGSRAKRCDDKTHFKSDRAPTVDDDWATQGMRLMTVWHQLDSLVTPTEIVGSWVLVDNSTGAAVWLELGGGVTDHGALDGLADDDHPQYIKDSEFTASGDTLRGTGAGTFAAVKNNLSATVAPTVNEDSGDGYAIGSRWLDVTADKEYVALDVSVGAAVWKETTNVAGGGATIIVREVGGSDITDVAEVEFDASDFVVTEPSAGIARVELATPGGGGGGWTLFLNESGASYANFTTGQGTWASDGTIISQTDTTASQRRNKHNTKFPMGLGVIMESDIRFPSSGQSASASTRAGFLIGTDGSANGSLTGYLQLNSDNANIDREGVTAFASGAVTINADTWYTFRMCVMATMVSLYVDGTLLYSTWIPAAMTGGNIYTFLGLQTFAAKADFRNIKAWHLTAP